MNTPDNNEQADNNHDYVAPVVAEPGVGRALSQGWGSMKRNFLVFLLAVLVIEVFMTPLHIGDGGRDGDVSALVEMLRLGYTLLLYPIVNYGADLMFIKGVRGDNVEVKTLFDGFRNYINIVLASLLSIGLIGIGTIVFVIPGIYVACRLAFVSYLVMDEGLDPIAAVEASWRITRGHALKIFVLGFLSIFIFLLGLALLIVGMLPATMWIKASFASLYLSITGQASAEQQAA